MPTPGTDWRSGQPIRIYDLEQPRFQGMPIHDAHQPGYLYVLHRRHSDGYHPGQRNHRNGASGVIVCMEHSGTHIDALCHQSELQTLFGGIDANAIATAKGFTELGVETIDPIVAPGVLLDLPAHRGVERLPENEAVTAEEMAACAERQGVTIPAGSVVLVRTGYGAIWDQPAPYLRAAGMHGDASRWVASHNPIAVGADNMAWDVIGLWDDTTQSDLPGHVEFLVRRGIYILENVVLEELAADKVYQFHLVCTPLKFTGATGSPVRPIAIVPA